MRVIERHHFAFVAGGTTAASGVTPATNVQHSVAANGSQVYTWSTSNYNYSYTCTAPLQAGVNLGANAQGKIALTAGGNLIKGQDCTTWIENKATGVIIKDDGSHTTVIKPNGDVQVVTNDATDPGDSNMADAGDGGSGYGGDDGSGGYAGGDGDGDGGGGGGGGGGDDGGGDYA